MFHIQHGATENTKQGGRQRKLCFQKSPYSIRKETFQWSLNERPAKK